jgi:hypothetical protein
MYEEKHERTGRPNSFLGLQRGKHTDQSGELMMSWESDQLIVLGGGRAVHKRKGLT